MEYTKELQVLFKRANPLRDSEYDILRAKAELLVKERIQGDRKGLVGEPNYMHSIRVHDLVSDLHHWDYPDYELFLAALLHDIVEDGGVSFEELFEMGFPGRALELIYLCSHDKSIKNKTERWILMVARLIEAKDDEAWMIKLTDLSDNLSQSQGLSYDNRKFMVGSKAPILLRLTEDNASIRPYNWCLRKTLEELGL